MAFLFADDTLEVLDVVVGCGVVVVDMLNMVLLGVATNVGDRKAAGDNVAGDNVGDDVGDSVGDTVGDTVGVTVGVTVGAFVCGVEKGSVGTII